MAIGDMGFIKVRVTDEGKGAELKQLEVLTHTPSPSLSLSFCSTLSLTHPLFHAHALSL